MYYVYVLVSNDKDRKTYVGYTSNLKRRLREHNENGSGKHYTGKRKWILVYYEAYRSEQDAKEREVKLKQRGSSKHSLMRRISNSLKL